MNASRPILKYSDRVILNYVYDIVPFFTAPINVFLIYLICFKSLKSMAKFRYYMIYSRIATWFEDIIVTGVFRMQVLPPLLLFSFQGPVAEWLGPTKVFSIGCAFFSLMICSLCLSLLYRNQALQESGSMLALSNGLYVFIAFSLHFIIGVPNCVLLYLLSATREEIAIALSKYANAYDVLSQHPCLFMIGDNLFSVIYLVYIGIVMIIVGSFGVAMNYNTFEILRSHRHTMSKATREAHKTAIRAILLELLLPVIVFVFPIGLTVFLHLLDVTSIDFSEIADAMLILIALHCIFDCFILITTFKCYQKAIIAIIHQLFGIRTRDRRVLSVAVLSRIKSESAIYNTRRFDAM